MQSYDTSKLTDKDVIKVMQDSTHSNALSYYRWTVVSDVGSFVYVGSEGPFYTKSETDTLLNAKQATIDGSHKLSADLVDDTSTTNKFVTASDKTAWSAKYDKPSGGIPKTDLASAVQTSLGKADSAIQNTDYATSNTGGVVKVNSAWGTSTIASGTYKGILQSETRTYEQYQSASNSIFIGKGTLENVITGKNLETANNKVTSISSSSTDTQYPSAKAVYDYIQSLDGNGVAY